MEQIPPEALLEGYPPVMQETAYALRSIVREAVPDAWERVRVGWHLIGYDLPLRRYGVYFAYVAPEPVHVHLGFEWGVFMSDPQGLLQGEGITRQVRWLTFSAPEQIAREPVIALVREGARVAALTRGERLARALDREDRLAATVTETLPAEFLLDGFPPAIRDTGLRLRRLIFQTVPGAAETVRPGWRWVAYSLPDGRRVRNFAWIGPERKHIHLGLRERHAAGGPRPTPPRRRGTAPQVPLFHVRAGDRSGRGDPGRLHPPRGGPRAPAGERATGDGGSRVRAARRRRDPERPRRRARRSRAEPRGSSVDADNGVAMEPAVALARTTDDVSIAWSSSGSGPALVYLPAAPFSNTAAEWSIPVLRRAFERLATRVRLIQFDARGTGRSQRDVTDLSLDAMLRDLEAVVGAAGVERYAIFGSYSAVTHAIAARPRAGRTGSRHVVLFGGAARGFVPMSGPGTQALLSLIERDWDTFVESAAHAWLGWPDPAQGRLAADWFRSATTPAIARATFEADAAIDVTAQCADVACPCLVIHRLDTPPIDLATAQDLAASLPHGRLEVVPGTSASLFFEHGEAMADLIADFVTGVERRRSTGRGPGDRPHASRGRGPAPRRRRRVERRDRRPARGHDQHRRTPRRQRLPQDRRPRPRRRHRVRDPERPRLTFRVSVMAGHGRR